MFKKAGGGGCQGDIGNLQKKKQIALRYVMASLSLAVHTKIRRVGWRVAMGG